MTRRSKGSGCLACVLTCLAVTGCKAPPEDACADQDDARPKAEVAEPDDKPAPIAAATEKPADETPPAEPSPPEKRYPNVRYQDLWPTTMNFVEAVSEGDASKIREHLDTPFRLLSTSGVSFCGVESEFESVLTRADAAAELDRIAECIAADEEVRKAFAKRGDPDFQVWGRRDVEDWLSAPAEFGQSTDVVYTHVERTDNKTSEVVECILSFREGDGELGRPVLAGLACGFDVRC